MPRPRKFQVDFPAAAARFQVDERTVRRWHAAGVDLADLEAVGTYLLQQKGRTSTEAIRAVREQLSDTP